MKVLVEAGADIHALSSYGDTPLHLCATSCNVEGAKTLLRAGANPDVFNHEGESPLAKAQKNGCNALVELLRA